MAELATWGADDEVYTRAKAKRDLCMAGFGLFVADEILAPLMRSDGISLDAALMKAGLTRGAHLLAVPNTSSKVADHLEGSDWQHGA